MERQHYRIDKQKVERRPEIFLEQKEMSRVGCQITCNASTVDLTMRNEDDKWQLE